VEFDQTTANFTITPRFAPGQAFIATAAVTPADGVLPPKVDCAVLAVPPSGTARLQVSSTFGAGAVWTDLATRALDGSGSVIFAGIPDSRPGASSARRAFFRVLTE